MESGKTIGPLTEINRILRENRVAEIRWNLKLGMRPIEFGIGTSKWSWAQQPPQTLNPFGTIQGGYLAVFIDMLFSTAIGSVLEEGEWSMTAESKVSYLRTLKPGPIEGAAKVIRRSRSLAFLEATITNPAGDAAVTASSTWAISRT